MERPDLDLSTRKAMLENLEHLDAYRKKYHELKEQGQLDIYDCIRDAENDDAA